MKSVGRSTATAPIAATCPRCRARTASMTRRSRGPDERRDQAAEREQQVDAAAQPLGTNASTSTPTMAAPNTTSIGASWLYSMLGRRDRARSGARRAARVTAGLPSGQLRMGGHRVGEWIWDIVDLTAGLITSSTGFG